MLKTSSKRPVTPNNINNDYKNNVSRSQRNSHWSEKIYECVVSISSNGVLNLQIDGGSDNGEFAYFGQLDQSRINYSKGNFEEGDPILEIQNQKVAGYTQRDIVAWLNHCCRSGNPVNIIAVRSGYLTKDLRQYLNSRFQKGSLDHDLQNTIRDNLYLRTVPCTTRIPREGEVNGVDYTFLSRDEFVALEKSGNLLESGIYEGNHYGTPKPPRETGLHSLQRGGGGTATNEEGVVLPGAHPSSEGKRRRNRSNVEAMASKSVDPRDTDNPHLSNLSTNSRSSTPQSSISRSRRASGDVPSDYSLDLGPLPDNWEKAYTETGEPYFIDHNSGNSQWLDPRLARVQKKSIEECDDDELPYGWERIDDPHYGTYYIDHVNRRTQYENPVIQARRATQAGGEYSTGNNFWYVGNAELNSCRGPTTNPMTLDESLPIYESGDHRANRRNPAATSVNRPRYYSPDKPLWNGTDNLIDGTNNNDNDHENLNGVDRRRNLDNGGINDPVNTNSESNLITSPASNLPETETSLAARTSRVSSSPDSSPRFPYLPCIPCLNEKQDANNNAPDRSSKSPAPDRPSKSPAPDRASKSPAPDRPSKSPAPEREAGFHSGNLTESGMENGLKKRPSVPRTPLATNDDGSTPGDDVDIAVASRDSLDSWVPSPEPPRTTYRGNRSHSEPRSGANSLYSQTALSGSSSLAPSRYRPYHFTRDPAKLEGEIVSTLLIKSARGFGFTIVGGDDAGAEEFLQIKSVVPNGPAWIDGKLKTGDVLVYVNGTCVLGFSHQDMVSLFQSIPPEETVHLEACRGYPLPFDPEDPNNEIVTTLAVNSKEGAAQTEGSPIYGTTDRSRNQMGDEPQNEAMGRAAKSMPDLSLRRSTENSLAQQRRNSADLLNAADNTPDILDFNPQSSSKPEYLTVEIVKGTAGFGFTIADSAYGQKVKKILDRQRCKLLQEGDILVKINDLDLRGLSHSDVVQVLKDCPCGDSAQITVQRGGSLSPTKNRGKAAKSKASDASVKSSGSLSQSFHLPDDLSFLPPLRGAYRSKTPTADLFSSREKESVSFSRPKTPLVDTRNWARSSAPSLGLPKPRNPDFEATLPNELSSNGVEMFRTKTTNAIYSPNFEDNSINGANGFGYKGDDSWNPAADLARTKDYPWLSRSFRDTRTLQRDRHSGFNPRNSDSKLRELYEKENHFSNGGTNNGRRIDSNSFYGNEEIGLLSQRQTPYNNDDWRRRMNSASNYSYPGNKTPAWLPRERSQVDGYDTRDVSALRGKTQTNNSAPFYSHYFNGQNAFSNYDTPPSNANAQQATSHFQAPESSSGYYTSAAISPHPSNASQSLSGSQYDSLTRRKHSTSFEHEQPITSLMSNQYSTKERAGHFQSPYGQQPPNLSSASQRFLLSSANTNSPSGVMEMTITLLRQESGFGFRIVGGTEEGSQVAIGHIVPGGAADLDSRLQTGDEIVSVDGTSVLNTSHHHVVQLMSLAAHDGKVILAIRRKLQNYDSLSKSADGIFPYDVTVTRKENEGFGFVIISSVTRVGSTIGRIIEGSPAERCGQLRVGDRILAVNGVSILNTHHGDIVNLIKDSGFSVTLTIGAPQDDASSSASISQRGDDHSMEHDDHYYAVELDRGLRGFGFSIRGGREFRNMPLFVLRIAEGGPAHQDGRLRVGDQIIEINGVNAKNMAHSEAIDIIKRGTNSARLLVKRGNKMSLAVVDQASPVTPTGSVGTPLSAGSSVMNGPICQSSPRDATANYEMPRDLWNYEPH